jgi:hypothetical protein
MAGSGKKCKQIIENGEGNVRSGEL